MFHRHRWEETQRYFVRPEIETLKADRINSRALRRLSEGVTVVELRCGECGDVGSRELAGDAVSGALPLVTRS